MTTTAPRILTGARWSSAVVCPRRAVYEHQGAPRADWSAETLSMFRRGRFIGRAIAEDMDESLREQGRPVGEHEREVKWPAEDPFATGHADYYIPDERTIVEVVSTADCALPAHKAVQAAGYALNDADADAGMVLSIDPSTYMERTYPLDLEGLREEVERVEWLVTGGVRTSHLPRRAMVDGGEVESPSQRPCFGCPYMEHCWKGHEPYPVGSLPETLHEAVVELADLEDQISRFKKVPHLEERRQVIRDRLRGQMIPGAKYRGAGIQVQFTPVAPSRRFSLSAFEKAGHEMSGPAVEFVTESGGFDKWTVRRLETDR